ncbi:MAG TPA: hypothetical protein VFZ56_05175 [Gemmatimonadaceae bacterium]
MLRALLGILAGMLLLADSLGRFRGLDAMIRALKPYETAIGVTALIVGIFSFFSTLGIALILAGLLLGANALATVPQVGDNLGSASRALAPFSVLIGAAVLILGILRLL